MSRTVAVIGGGWAGLAAAVQATRRGWHVTLYEASRHWGGRARQVKAAQDDATRLPLDNGQHILIGAYTQTLHLMQSLDLPVETLFQAVPLDLRYPDGTGVSTPSWARHWPAPLDTLAAIVTARGWNGRDRLSFLKTAAGWQRAGFACPATTSVQDLCTSMTARVMEDLVEPLCVAALNTPAARASGQVFLKVLQDALLGQGFGSWRSAQLLLPRQHLGALLPEAAIRFLHSRGADIREGQRVRHLSACGDGWQVEAPGGVQTTDAVILACPASEAARLLTDVPDAPEAWRQQAMQLTHEPIATVYVAGTLSKPWPSAHGMVALRNGASAPAQYAFHRSLLLGSVAQPNTAEPDVVELALVASASHLERQALETAALAQARQQLGLEAPRWVQTVVEKRATFACTPGLSRPAQVIRPHLLVAGDYVEGPYPATLEGAVRSGLQAADRLIPASTSVS